jgi:hypothetical protein
MTSIFASNGPQPFTSSTHQRLTFGQHFFGILQNHLEMFINVLLEISLSFYKSGITWIGRMNL